MTDSRQRSPRVLFGLTNRGLFIAGIASFGVGTWCAFHGESANLVISLISGLLLLFAATIDRFELRKTFGDEVKESELDEEIQKADEAVRKLRTLTRIAEAARADLNSTKGPLGTAPRLRNLFAITERIRTALQALGSEPQTVDQVLRPITATICRELAFGFSRPLLSLAARNIRELKARRSSTSAENPQLSKLESAIAAGEAYLTRMNSIYALPLDEFREGLTALLDDFPYQTVPEFPSLRERATALFSDIGVLAETMRLPNQEMWMLRLEQASEREAAGEL